MLALYIELLLTGLLALVADHNIIYRALLMGPLALVADHNRDGAPIPLGGRILARRALI